MGLARGASLIFLLGALLASLSGCKSTVSRSGEVRKPRIISAAEWGSRPDPFAPEQEHDPRRITLHHAGVTWKAGDDPLAKIRGLQSWGKREKGWADVPYHFLVAPDGRIYEGRRLSAAGDTNTEYDPRGHALVQLWGNFEEQRVGKEQLEATVHLVAWLCQELRIGSDQIAGHRDVSRQTTCPGKDLGRYLADGSLRRWVETLLAGERAEVMVGPALPGGPTALTPR